MTIFAHSTSQARAAIAIIRISGAHAATALEALTTKSLPPPRQAAVRKLYDAERLLDEVLVLYFPAPHSFTGEDMVELHLHGGVAIVESVMRALSKQPHLRPAEAGEFTRQAVINGRLDILQAESIADMIEAETAAQQSQALRQMRGELGKVYDNWRATLHNALAHIEADIEFAEEDLPGGVGVAALEGLDALSEEISLHLQDRRGEQLRNGIEIALIGPPNSGKSTIINMLSGKAAAIVSARAGTTRDVVEVHMALGEVPVILADTAGLREAGDDIEREGVRRAKARAELADLRIFVSSPDALLTDMPHFQPHDIVIFNKSDIAAPEKKADFIISAKTGDGVAAFLSELEKRVANQFGLSEAPAMTRLRHRQALEEAHDALQRGLKAQDKGLDLVAEDLRLAARALGRITGAVDVEGLLDIVFSDFCIGK